MSALGQAADPRGQVCGIGLSLVDRPDVCMVVGLCVGRSACPSPSGPSLQTKAGVVYVRLLPARVPTAKCLLTTQRLIPNGLSAFLRHGPLTKILFKHQANNTVGQKHFFSRHAYFTRSPSLRAG